MSNTKNTSVQTALITGASKGLGRALAEALAKDGWQLIINARNPNQLLETQRHLEQWTKVIALSGDVRDEIHLIQFPEKLNQANWQINLLVNNASTLGVSPQPTLLNHSIETIHQVFHTNVIAPLSLIQKVEPFLVDKPSILNISSDAAVNAYEKWGGYGASKAALDQLTLILGKENPEWKVLSVDPGDMRTDMHQAAFPNEDISDRPLPEEIAVPALLQLIYNDMPSARYEANKVAHSF